MPKQATDEDTETAVSTEVLPARQSPIQKRLAAFLAGELRKQGLREAEKVELHFAARVGRPGARGEPIQEWHKDDDPELFDLRSVFEFASRILAYAENACDAPGQQRFTVAVVNRADGKARMSLIIEGVDASSSDFESGDMQAIVSQQMRHIEVLLRASLHTANAANETLARQLEIANDRIVALEKARIEHFDEREKLLSRDQERAIDLIKVESSEKRMDAGFDKILALAPAVVNRFAGKKLLEEKETPKEQMLRQLAGSLSSDGGRLREILGALSTKLRADEMILLAELLREAQAPASEDPPNGVNGAS